MAITPENNFIEVEKISDKLQVGRVIAGNLDNNNYFLIKGSECLVIDVTDSKVSLDFIKKHKLHPRGVILTHTHWDHLLGLEEFLKNHDVPVYYSSQEPNYLSDGTFDGYKTSTGHTIKLNSSGFKHLSEGSHNIAGFNFETIATPGHTKCSMTIYLPKEELMFTGDFLFRKSVGITTAIYSDSKAMKESLKKIITYNSQQKEIKIFPGHGAHTTLKKEVEDNIHLQNLENY